MIAAIFSSIVWLGFVELLSLGLLPLWCSLFSASAEKVLGYSRFLSLLFVSWIIWLLSQYAGVPFLLPLIFSVSLGALSVGYLTLRLKFNSWRVFLYDQNLYRTYLVYLLILAIFIVFRALNPEIYWGEKPLEFTLFNYLSRETQLPAEHPWAAGSNMSYYYIGFFSLAILQKVSGLDPSIGFNLSVAFIAACLFSAFQALFLNLRLSNWGAFLAAALLTFGANLNPVYLALVIGRKFEFDLFWTTTRNFTSPAFAEYPIWSLLFADLHPHVIAMPLVVCLLGLTWASTGSTYFDQQKRLDSPLKTGLTIATGLVWGLLYSVNGWDFISTAIMLAILFGLSAEAKFNWPWIKLQLSYVTLLSLSAAATMLPFRLAQQNIFAAFWGWVITPEYNQILHIWLHQGVSLTIIFLSTIGLLLLQKKSPYLSSKPEKSLINVAFFPVAIGILCVLNSSSGAAWHVIAFSVCISLVAIIFYSTDRDSPQLRFCCLLVLAGANLLSISESFYLIDRMNTIFKGYQLLWPLFGVPACLLLFRLTTLISTSAESKNPSVQKYLALRFGLLHTVHVLCFAVIAVSLIGTIINCSIVFNVRRTNNDYLTLNGTGYLEKTDQDEAYLIRWLQKNVSGKAYIAEASGDSYQSFTRVAMHTGLPTLLGWEHHSRQGGVAQEDLNQRKLAIKTIFESNDLEKSYELLQHYGIDFVFIGKEEIEKYPAGALKKFASNPEMFIAIASKGKYTLYLCRFSPLKGSLLSKIESRHAAL